MTLGLRDESSGTIRLLELAGRVIPVLDTGGLLLVDEIDSSWHTLLTAALVRLFRPRAAASGGRSVPVGLVADAAHGHELREGANSLREAACFGPGCSGVGQVPVEAPKA